MAGAPAANAPRDTTVVTPVPPGAARTRRAAALLASLEREGEASGPEALQGYEAMRLVLDAIGEGGPDREAVARAAFETSPRESLLGRYSVLASGDVRGLRLHLVGLEGRRAGPVSDRR
jgi:ABC-type branched-subunit amino acid transport system substrate-binding protein